MIIANLPRPEFIPPSKFQFAEHPYMEWITANHWQLQDYWTRMRPDPNGMMPQAVSDLQRPIGALFELWCRIQWELEVIRS